MQVDEIKKEVDSIVDLIINKVIVYAKIWKKERGNSKLSGLCHQGID